MTKWYRIKTIYQLFNEPSGTNVGNAYCIGYKTANGLLGVDTPVYINIAFTAISGTADSLAFVRCYIDDTYDDLIYAPIYSSGSSSSHMYRRGFPSLIKVTDNNTFAVPENLKGAFDVVGTSTISGKYRINNIITYPKLNFSAVPVKFYHNSGFYDMFSFTSIKIPWYVLSDAHPRNRFAAVWGIEGEGSEKDYIHLDNYVANNIAWGKYDDIKNDGTYDGLTYITDNYDNYIGSVIDFGSSPQEVPETFKEWIDTNFTPLYDNEYIIKSNDGKEVLATILEAPPMISAALSTIGNAHTLVLSGANGQTYQTTWESETPKGKRFLGLSYTPNAKHANVPDNNTTDVQWGASTTLYEVYATYRPPTTTFDINLYQSSAEGNRVDKTGYLTDVGTLSGVLREECSMVEPVITFQMTDPPMFNYVRIVAFGRWYFVTGITSVSKNVWRMSLSCDVLMSYRSQIWNLTATIARQENDYNPLLQDSELPAQANQVVTVQEFPVGEFKTDESIQYPFVLTVVGA